jgi:hypothetical protein
VKVRIYEDRIEVFYGDIHQLTIERLLGRNGHRIDYRHIIWSLVDKPGAFPRYRYREELFPGLLFRRAYDALCEAFGHGREADLHYLRILHQAASVSESEVEAALALMLETHVTPDADRVQELVQPKQPEVPQMAPYATICSRWPRRCSHDPYERDTAGPRCPAARASSTSPARGRLRPDAGADADA